MWKWALLTFLIFLSLGCEFINPEEPAPSVIQIEEIVLNTNAEQGSASHRITEAWVSVDDNFLGVYSLPAKIPLLNEGLVKLKVEAGIRDNGISATPEIYPFYQIFEDQVNLTPLEPVDIPINISYLDNTRFALIEDFETSQVVFNEVRLGQPMEISRDTVFEGAGAGRISVAKDLPITELSTTFRFQGLQAKSPFVYLEMDYWAEVPVVFGIIGFTELGGNNETVIFEPGFFASDNWKKIYFNLSPVLAANEFVEFKLILRAFVPEGAFPEGQNLARVWLDNIKLVHF